MGMDRFESRRIASDYHSKPNHTQEEDFLYLEACHYLAEIESDVRAMVALGGHYYGMKRYNLAEKYYLMAFEIDPTSSASGLGYIYYYGRNGERDFEKAFRYFSIASEDGDNEARMKIADMYRNGYGVEKDLQKYKEQLLSIYEAIKDTKLLFDPYPEVAHRLAEIYIDEGHGADALAMLWKAKSLIGQRLHFSQFWGDFIVCRRVVTLLYRIIPFEPYDFDFYSLFFYFRRPNKARLYFHGKEYALEAFEEEGEIRVKCEEAYYKSVEAFLMEATFDGMHVHEIDYDDYYSIDGEEPFEEEGE